MSPERSIRAQVYLLLAASGRSPCMVQTLQCRNDSGIIAGPTVLKFTSPHVYPSNKFDVSCWWRITAFGPDNIVCLLVQFPEMTNIRNCMMTYLDVYDGFDSDATILGRWCDMNSPLLRSTGNQTFVYSKTPVGVQFKFDVWYCTNEFSMGNMSNVSVGTDNASSLSTGVILGIAACLLIAVAIFSVITRHVVRKTCWNRPQNTGQQTPSVSSGVESNPPDYWSVVVSPSREVVAFHPRENPPAYWDVVTMSEENTGSPLHEDHRAISIQERHRTIPVQGDQSAIPVQEDQSAISVPEDHSVILQQNHYVIPREDCNETPLSQDNIETPFSGDHGETPLALDHSETALALGHSETA
ncbi:uncharacterized protein LOC124148979 isoform X1 [Haliotis rufescens]|uniref:uncharacterized protein LOC124148979 isoform X1 n=1 Tax=Haliotis rufescens TaxID=6454 RepID=UPI00201ED01D|nr:uncharacterized protein LOC124148979 isoform X1 [Haliotis rufescens]